MRNENTPIAVEGYPFIALAGFVTVVLALLSWKLLAVLGLCATLFCAYFFRNPERIVPEDGNAVLAPADGKVIFIGNVPEERLHGETVKISIFMSVFNVHINRAPVSGKVFDLFYKRGKFLDVRDSRATFENEQSGMLIETAGGVKLMVVQVAGLIARRIVCYAQKGDDLVRGERYGLIRFGSRLDVYLPRSTDLRVSVGDKTVAGETILGYLP
ncbi:MAG TPA: phosphatidylserine decarboxylase family protein [Geobacteraceae bacterium]|nr:phosphatidylserine decarboxylase family protein [Geobacteraceae bacterium]